MNTKHSAVLMNPMVKRVLICLMPIFLILLGIGIYQVIPLLFMTPAATGAVEGTGIYAVRNARNAVFFIQTDSGYIMIDAGSGTREIEEYLSDNDIYPEEVKWILLTHSDYDHVAALTLFPHADVYISEAETALLDGSVRRNASGGNELPVPTGDLILLQDGQQLILGTIRIKCIQVSGHTVGSMSFLVEDRFLFTGDAFRVKNGRLALHPFSMDTVQSNESIQYMRPYIEACEWILTGHYGVWESQEIVKE